MLKIGEIVIDEDIAYERFTCNLSDCKGACCTLYGGRGAPLSDAEVEELQCALPFARQYLNEQHLLAIRQNGIVEGVSGYYATACIESRACVFVYYENEIARCSVERAFLEGLISWRKPLSCHLFPVRISPGTSERMRYEKISECFMARKSGNAQNIQLYDFLSSAIIRKYGQDWYDQFRKECESRNNV